MTTPLPEFALLDMMLMVTWIQYDNTSSWIRPFRHDADGDLNPVWQHLFLNSPF